MYNVATTDGPPATFNCCYFGYHAFSNLQTYAQATFVANDLFGPGLQDTSVLTHEVGEWMNDPYGNDYAPLWGHTGQVSGCYNYYEVGDPLTGTNLPLVTMPNGFSYHLQEMAFFSWFFGPESLGVNGWYSDNATFLNDAGPICQP